MDGLVCPASLPYILSNKKSDTKDIRNALNIRLWFWHHSFRSSSRSANIGDKSAESLLAFRKFCLVSYGLIKLRCMVAMTVKHFRRNHTKFWRYRIDNVEKLWSSKKCWKSKIGFDTAKNRPPRGILKISAFRKPWLLALDAPEAIS